jgi:transcriptional/translational regulatory protein YebC/TACO1
MMWKRKIRIKHLFTKKEDWKSVQESMNSVADVLDKKYLPRFSTKKFRDIPKDNKYAEPVEYANKLLDKLYDYADANRIWIE